MLILHSSTLIFLFDKCYQLNNFTNKILFFFYLQDALLGNDKNGFKGLRKQFSGRFKRLVAKKNEPAPAIPPELKPQLKTIYVY